MSLIILSSDRACLARFDCTREDYQPNILLTKSGPINLLTYPEHSQLNKNRFAPALAMQFGEAAADMVLFDLEKETYKPLKLVLR